MSTKVKRTPLFGHDGNLGIPIIPRDTKVIALVNLLKVLTKVSPKKDERVSQNLYIFHFPVCFSLAFFGWSKIKSVSQSLKSGTCNQLKSWEKISGQFSPIHWQNCWILSPQKTIICQTSLRLKSSDKELDNLLLISMWFIRFNVVYQVYCGLSESWFRCGLSDC